MTVYGTTYKCRLCGTQFVSGQASDNYVALKAMIGVINNDSMGMIQMPTLHSVHNCKDGSLGLADFLGMELKEE